MQRSAERAEPAGVHSAGGGVRGAGCWLGACGGGAAQRPVGSKQNTAGWVAGCWQAGA